MITQNNDTDTLLVHGGIDRDEPTGAVSVPIYQTSTFKQSGLGEHTGFEYSRTKNPTRSALESLIAQLEGGTAGFAFASGMAAITAVLMLFKSGDRILISNNVYGGTFRVIDKVFTRFGLNYDIIDTTRADSITSIDNSDGTIKAIIIESPANPLLTVTDIRLISAIAQSKGILTIVDNTFMTPYLQKPLDLGADIVIHSATKYLGGHSDLIAGLAVVKSSDMAERLGFIQNATGGILEPFDSWLLIRGIRTLGVRMDRHVANAIEVVDYLKSNDSVVDIYYPGLADNPGYEIHRSQAKAPGAMISFTLSNRHDIKAFFRSFKIITLGESLGGVETLISCPSLMTHASIPPKIRHDMGITDNLVRLSVGIENVKDIICDLQNAISISEK